MLRYITSFLILLAISPLLSQSIQPWTVLDEASFSKSNLNRMIIPDAYMTYSLEFTALKKALNTAPLRFSAEADIQEQPVVDFPMPSGKSESFRLMESNVMHPELAAKYPGIKTYVGISLDNPEHVIHCGYSHKGFHGMIKSPSTSTVFIDTYAESTIDKYICYHKSAYTKGQSFSCLVEDVAMLEKPSVGINSKLAGDCQLRIYDLALACTGEYAQFHGGTIPDVMAAFANSMVRVNGIYESDLNVTMVLIPNNDELIFLDGSSDPYTNNNGGTMLGQNQATIDDIIGIDNYHIGHVYSTGGGGIASLRSPCTNRRAQGVTGLGSPIGDPFWVDYVAHEIGHQFGGNHTQNNSCNRAGNAAVEPGSASTIMGYAGICPPNVQNNSDDHFNGYNIAEMQDFILGNGSSCSVLAPNGNNAPTISVPAVAYNMPISTPFVLTATGEDIDEENVLTYCWEQQDAEVATMPPTPTNTGGPAFRSNSPTLSPSRYFPNLDAVIAGSTPTWEVLPSVSRAMDFRCTLRDNNLTGGCTDEADVVLTFHGEAGPFLVNSPNTADVLWTVGENQLVEWDVANTDAAPIETALVDIYLSEDGGYTYPYLLLAATPNDGMESIEVPQVDTDQARVMVKASENVFYDISNENFTIQEPLVPTFVVDISPAYQVGCQNTEVIYDIQFQSFLDYNEEVTLSTTVLQEGLSAEFTPVSANSTAMSSLSLTGIENLEAGVYTIEITAESTDITRITTVELEVLEPLTATSLESPDNGSLNIATQGAAIDWSNVNSAESYTTQISTDPGFQDIILDTITFENIVDLPILEGGTVYYWRVKSINSCEETEYSSPFAFQTIGGVTCNTFSNTDPIPIPPDIISTIEVTDDDPIYSMAVYLNIAHEYVGDLDAFLIGPDETTVTLFDRPGLPESQFGCSNENMEVTLYDLAPNSAEDLENTCEASNPTIEGEYQPLEPFSTFNGLTSGGTWTLDINDLYPDEDDGNLLAWSIEICKGEPLQPATLANNTPINLPQGKQETLNDTHLLLEGNPSASIYTLVQLPTHGDLLLNTISLGVGDRFTQSDINAGNLVYAHSGENSDPDQFLFDVISEQGNWLPNQVMNIIIVENTLEGMLSLSTPLLCKDETTAVIDIVTTGGFEPFTFVMNDQTSEDNPTFENIGAGTYTFTIIDRFGCELVLDPITIENPESFTVSAEVVDNSITVSTEGSVGDLQYQLNDGAFQDSNLFDNLINGMYTITVQDSNGCEASTTAEINVSELQSSAVVLTPISCFGESDGVIIVEVSGGIPPYEYSLDGFPYQEDNTYSELAAGEYNFTVRDAAGTTSETTLTLSNPAELTGMLSVVNNQITVLASGGIGNLAYAINGGDFQDSNVFEGLENGDYTITVIDENDCTLELSTNINIPPLVLVFTNIIQINCFGGQNGALEVDVVGGVPPYSFSIDGITFQDSSNFTNLPTGAYIVTVRDALDNINTIPYTLDEPEQLTGEVSVAGSNIEVTAQGGTPPYNYVFNNAPSQMDNTFVVETNGEYEVVVIDANDCFITLPFVINTPVDIGFNITLIDCAGNDNGIITITDVIEGIGPFNYALNSGDFGPSPTFENLSSGDYQIRVQDANGAIFLGPLVVIDEPEAVMIMTEIEENNLTVIASGGTGTYEYSADNSAAFQESNIFLNLANGDYTIVVMDSNGCTTSTIITIDFTSSTDDQLDAIEFSVFPNPNTGSFEITLNEEYFGHTTISIYSMLGNLVYQEIHSNSNQSINVGHLSDGQYIIHVANGDKHGTARLAILR